MLRNACASVSSVIINSSVNFWYSLVSVTIPSFASWSSLCSEYTGHPRASPPCITTLIFLPMDDLASYDNLYFFPFSSNTLFCLICILQSSAPVLSTVTSNALFSFKLSTTTVAFAVLSTYTSYPERLSLNDPFLIFASSTIFTLSREIAPSIFNETVLSVNFAVAGIFTT